MKHNGVAGVGAKKGWRGEGEERVLCFPGYHE
jgi:hypothetical protein